jgi:endonuclease/exonuclease/phosphatase family metal-dependent hydrolase
LPGREDGVIVERGRFRRVLRRGGAALGVALTLFIAYRLFFVYTFTHYCPPPPTLEEGVRMIPETISPSGAGPTLKVLSYNISGHSTLLRSGHVTAIAELIAEEKPDLVGLQEVHRGTWQSRFRDQAAEIAARTGLTLHFGPSYRALGGEFGNAVLVRGRVLAAEVLPLPSYGEPRTMLRTEVEVDGFVLDFFVTHLAAWGSWNRRMRTEQTACLVEQVRASGRPYVLCGDFNAPPDARELDVVVRNDIFQLCGIARESTHSLLDRRLDYIFSDPRFEVVDARVLRRGKSDHWPVVAELRWENGR